MPHRPGWPRYYQSLRSGRVPSKGFQQRQAGRVETMPCGRAVSVAPVLIRCSHCRFLADIRYPKSPPPPAGQSTTAQSYRFSATGAMWSKLAERTRGTPSNLASSVYLAVARRLMPATCAVAHRQAQWSLTAPESSTAPAALHWPPTTGSCCPTGTHRWGLTTPRRSRPRLLTANQRSPGSLNPPEWPPTYSAPLGTISGLKAKALPYGLKP